MYNTSEKVTVRLQLAISYNEICLFSASCQSALLLQKKAILVLEKPVETCFQAILVTQVLFHKRAFTANLMVVPFPYNL